MTYLVKHRRPRQAPRRAVGDFDFTSITSLFTGGPSVTQVTAATGIPAPSSGTDTAADIFGGLLGIPPLDIQAVFDRAGGQATSVCVDQANQQQAQFEAMIDPGLTKGWQPSGFYSPDQLHQVVTQVMTLVSQAQADVQSAMGSWSGDPSDYQNALDLLGRMATGQGIQGVIGTNGAQYLATEQDARARGANVIDAADLKKWAINSLMAVSNAYVTIYVINCQTPLWISVLARVGSAIAAVCNFLLGVLGVVVKIGDAILSAPGALSNVFGVLKFGALAYAAWWAYNQYKKKR